MWKVDGYDTGDRNVQSRGINATDAIVSSDESFVFSQLRIPQSKANSNSTVICIVIKDLLIPSSAESSEPVKLILQGMFVVVCILCVLYACRYMIEPFH